MCGPPILHEPFRSGIEYRGASNGLNPCLVDEFIVQRSVNKSGLLVMKYPGLWEPSNSHNVQ